MILLELVEVTHTHQLCSSRPSAAWQSQQQGIQSPHHTQNRPPQRRRAATARGQAASSSTVTASAQASSAPMRASAATARIACRTSSARSSSTWSKPKSTSRLQPTALPTQLRVEAADARNQDAAKTTASASSRGYLAQPDVRVVQTARTISSLHSLARVMRIQALIGPVVLNYKIMTKSSIYIQKEMVYQLPDKMRLTTSTNLSETLIQKDSKESQNSCMMTTANLLQGSGRIE